MKLSCSYLVVAAVCVFPCASHAGTGHWDPHVSLDSILMAPGVLPSAGITPAGPPVATAEAYFSAYQRIALQSEAAGTVGGEAARIKITPPRLLFILATDLEIIGAGPKTSANTLASALSSTKNFRNAVLPFLKNWRHLKDSTRTLEGLSTVAKLIASDQLPTTKAWRFGVSPIPAGPRGPKLSNPPVFEIRLIISVDDVVPPDDPQRAELAGQLAAMGSNDAEFLKAMKTLRDRLTRPPCSAAFPMAAELIEAVFFPAK